MAKEKKQLSTEEIEKLIEDAQYEDWKLEKAGKGRVELSIDLAKKSMNETYDKKLKECTVIIDLCEKYYNLVQYDNTDSKCLHSKLIEIFDTMYDMFFLIMSAKYKTAKILIRKWLELVVLSIYFDTMEKNDTVKEMWINVDDMGSLGFYTKLKQLSDNADSIYKTYKKLSLYAHNEGEKWKFPTDCYDEKEFNEIYSEIAQIQLEIEKMIEKNYKGKILMKKSN